MAPDRAAVKLRLNPEQLAAVAARAGTYAVLAGPGSGKTTVLVQRYKQLLHEGAQPEEMLSLSFTSEAAKNMRTRVEALGVELQKTERVSGFVTFHSLALSFATEEHSSFPFQLAAFPLATGGQTYKIMGDAARKHELHPRDLAPWISLQKRSCIDPKEAIAAAEKAGVNQAKALAYKVYETKLREMGVLDFDGLLLEMHTVLAKHPEVRKRWQYKWVQTDEAQDNDSLQWGILQLITLNHGNLFAVGDAGQGIYGWRGAQTSLFLDMKGMFPEVETLYLARNHRSTQEIVKFIQTIGPIKELAERFHTENEAGLAPTITQYPTEAHEATAAARAAEDDPNAWAVLARTNRALRPIEDALSEYGIKYHVLGSSGFWTRPEVVSVLAYCACAAGNANDSAVLTALRSPFEPSRYLKKKQIADGLKDLQKRDPAKPSIMNLLYNHAEAGARGFGRSLWNLKRLHDMPAAYGVKEVLKEIKALSYYQDEESAEADNSPVENLLELQKIAERFQSLHDLIAHARRAQAASRNRKGVALATVHAAKGMEWPCVSLVGCSEGLLPHKNAEDPDGEEKNIFFVACSRPEQSLRISYVGQPSRFLSPFLKKEEPCPV